MFLNQASRVDEKMMAAVASAVLTASLTFGGAPEESEALVGHWRAVDPSGITSIIELQVQDQVMYGRIVLVLDSNLREVNPLCERCRGALKDRPIKGITFLYGLRKQGRKWIGGKVIDLRPGVLQGVTANCELEIEGNRAKIFGYLGNRLFSGTNYWDRVETP